MIRKLNANTYCLHPAKVARNFGGWDAAVWHVRAAGASHRKAIAVFKRARPAIPLQPRRERSAAW
ncbi:MAG TPA: hypothetical protein VFZ03_10020 [Dongiaceae bacterium]